MKKILAFFLCLFGGVVVVNADTLTITYDANDGSGRTKVVELEKGDSYEIAGNDIFEQLNDDPDDPMDDKVIGCWGKNPDNSGCSYDIFNVYKYNPNSFLDMSYWESLNNETELTLYAKWEERKDVTGAIESIIPSGEGFTYDGENVTIDPSKSFTLIIKVAERGVANQFGQLNYIDLPDYFVDYLDSDKNAREAFEKRRPFIMNVTLGSDHYEVVCYYQIYGDKLFYDLTKDGSQGSVILHKNTSTWVRSVYQVEVNKVLINNRWVAVKTVTFNEEVDEAEVIYPKGTIIVKYIDIDTGEEIYDEDVTTKEVTETFKPTPVDIDDYELVESPEDKDYYYNEEETQILYFKYRKKKVEEPIEEPKEEEKKEPNKEETVIEEPKKEEPEIKEIKTPIEEPKEENPNTGSYLPILTLIISFIVLVIFKAIKDKTKKYV